MSSNIALAFPRPPTRFHTSSDGRVSLLVGVNRGEPQA